MTEPTIETKRFQCRHIFTDGRRCASPCLRGPDGPEDFSYFHHTSRRPAQNPRARRSRRSTFALPLPEDRSAIQLSIGQVLQKIASNDIDPRRAGLLLYGLQIAAMNLPRTRPVEPAKAAETVEEVTLDPAHGTLAPQADFTETQAPKGSAERMLEELRALDDAPLTLPVIRASAVHSATLPSHEQARQPPLPALALRHGAARCDARPRRSGHRPQPDPAHRGQQRNHSESRRLPD